MRKLYGLFILAITAALLIFAVSNRADVNLRFWPLPWEIVVPLFVALFLSAAVGIVLTALASLGARWRWRRAARRSDARARAAEEEARQLRAKLADRSGAQNGDIVSFGHD